MKQIDLNVQYYEKNAKQYAAVNDVVNMMPLYNQFLPFLPIHGRILDAGCGTGRDSLYFLNAGYQVDAFDASPAMVRLAAEKTGLPVRKLRFLALTGSAIYDGVWASASLLHVPENELGDVFKRIHRVLKTGGVFYGSFKIGVGEVNLHQRRFTMMDEEHLERLMKACGGFGIVSMYRSPDFRSAENPDWLNFVWQKIPE